MSIDTVEFIPVLKCRSSGSNVSLLAVIARSSRMVGMQQNITLHGDNDTELVKALRVHPKFEGKGMKELLAFVRKEANGNHELHIKLSKKLVSTFSAVLDNEGIGVRVATLSA